MRRDLKLPAAFAGGIALAWLAMFLIAARLFDRAKRRSMESA